MGHIINPISFRLGVVRYWNAVWSLSKLSNYANLINQDFYIKDIILSFFKKLLTKFKFFFFVSNLKIIRKYNQLYLFIYFYDSNIEWFLRKELWAGVTFLNKQWKFHKASITSWKGSRWIKWKFGHEYRKFFTQGRLQYRQFMPKLLRIIFRFLVYSFKKTFSFFWLLMKMSLSYLLSKIIAINPLNIFFIGVNNRTVSASFIGKFVKFYLERSFPLFFVLKQLMWSLKKLIRLKHLFGFKVKVIGRFKRGQMAACMVRNRGSLNSNVITKKVDFFSTYARMKYGTSGIKVWLFLTSSNTLGRGIKISRKFLKSRVGSSLIQNNLSLKSSNSINYLSGKVPYYLHPKFKLYTTMAKILNYSNSSFFDQIRTKKSIIFKYSYIY